MLIAAMLHVKRIKMGGVQYLSNEFDFLNVHGIMNASCLLQVKPEHEACFACENQVWLAVNHNTTPVSLLVNGFHVPSVLHGKVSLAAVNQFFFFHEAMNGCKNLAKRLQEKACFEKCKYIPGLQLRVRNEKLIFLFLNQNICCGYSKEPSQ